MSTRDLTTRTLTLRAATANEQDRSVEAVLATETPTLVYDWRTGETIEEILLVDGAKVGRQVPMLSCHSRWSMDDVLGSVRSIRPSGEELLGRLYFANDEISERAWLKVRDGHVTDVSVGYTPRKKIDIAAGQSATINGRTFTAGQRAMRVTSEWTLKELSVVPVGADEKAKIRGESDPAAGED
ncbi:MAG TPA: hypothetical protein VLM89_08130, partial [Phycisphaerae bacterium]|nr:hypothetical protein [Phycisphaerae bacterium]